MGAQPGKRREARARPGFGGEFINLLTITDTRLSESPCLSVGSTLQFSPMEGSACLSLKIGADRWLSGQKQQTVNLPAHVAYGGSNPPLSTT